jgi:hypothetical protein
MSAADIKLTTVVGSKRPHAPAPPIPARPAQKPNRGSNCLPPDVSMAVSESAALYHRLLEGEKRIDFTLDQARQGLSAMAALTPGQSSQQSALPVMSAAPRPITRLLRLAVQTQLEEGKLQPVPYSQQPSSVAQWTVFITGRLVEQTPEGEAAGAAPQAVGDLVELGQYLQALRIEVASDPPVMVECPSRGSIARPTQAFARAPLRPCARAPHSQNLPRRACPFVVRLAR